jgi:hypothetical protein
LITSSGLAAGVALMPMYTDGVPSNELTVS